jgi:NTP pyrophosphatase (non-canonical NTP hydrolase)
MSERRHEVAAFLDEHDLRCESAFRALDLVSEAGEIAKNAAESTNYGTSPDALEIESDEIGDGFFSLLALADSLGIDADDALSESMAKYRTRLDETGSASSGE